MNTVVPINDLIADIRRAAEVFGLTDERYHRLVQAADAIEDLIRRTEERDRLHEALCEIGNLLGLPMPEYRTKMLPELKRRLAMPTKEDVASTRDFLAATAMNAFLYADAENVRTEFEIAQSSYRMADAMLQARGENG